MSFMFNPCRFDDTRAVNHLTLDQSVAELVKIGTHPSVSAISKDIFAFIEKRGRCVMAIDGYPGAELSVILNLIEQYVWPNGTKVQTLLASDLYKSAEELEKALRKHLPEDRVMDPVLLYGSLYDGGYPGLFDTSELEKAVKTVGSFRTEGEGLLIICGYGSLSKPLRRLADIRCWADISPKNAILNIRDGRYINIGDKIPKHFKQMMRRCYYVDFECAQDLRKELFAEGALDWYLSCSTGGSMDAVPYSSLKAILAALSDQPLRCKPVYLEGIWGGHYLTRIRELPKGIRNCAWCFDFIPMEVSLLVEFSRKTIELPFYTLLQSEGLRIMGDTCMRVFKGYFPIRFNYDDTWHSNGNMSIQVHPHEEYVTSHNNELGRQDESYYIVEAAQDAKTYLGFRDDADPEAFISEVLKSEREHTPIDYSSYVNAVPSKPGLQVMIPAGTLHASGRNQIVLEIGSLTVGSYTYKMYDYLRSDLDGIPRPIHSKHGSAVLRRERNATWVAKNITQQPRILRSGGDFTEYIVGQHDLLYYSLRTVSFETTYPDDTAGQFHVLTLVNGERVRVEAVDNPCRCFVLSYLDIVLVPAAVGAYRVVNEGNQPATIHKTLLKEGYEHEFKK